MKATISELWNTGIEIITYDNSEFDRPISILDLKKCDNVLVDKKDKNINAYPVVIDDRFCFAISHKVQHPSGGGSMYVIEIY